jgi:hypothetical protein
MTHWNEDMTEDDLFRLWHRNYQDYDVGLGEQIDLMLKDRFAWQAALNLMVKEFLTEKIKHISAEQRAEQQRDERRRARRQRERPSWHDGEGGE